MKYHLKPIRKAKIRKPANTKYWQGCGAVRGTEHYWWACTHSGVAEDACVLKLYLHTSIFRHVHAETCGKTLVTAKNKINQKTGNKISTNSRTDEQEVFYIYIQENAIQQ